MSAPDGEAGAGSVLVVALCCVLVVGGLGVGAVVQAAVARHAVATAADLGALAAADRSAVADPAPCAAAERVLEAHGSELTRCAVLPDGSVLVTAQRGVGGVLAGRGPARASARAGPAP